MNRRSLLSRVTATLVGLFTVPTWLRAIPIPEVGQGTDPNSTTFIKQLDYNLHILFQQHLAHVPYELTEEYKQAPPGTLPPMIRYLRSVVIEITKADGIWLLEPQLRASRPAVGKIELVEILFGLGDRLKHAQSVGHVDCKYLDI